MKKYLSIVATMALVATLLPAAFAQQQPSSQPSPMSGQQTSPTTPDAQQPPDQSGGSTAQPDSSASSSFVGTVVKAGGQYVLKTASGTFQLDDQAQAKRYQGKDVKVSGTLDKNTGVLHVTDIAPAGQSY
jgi:hypothetical protein